MKELCNGSGSGRRNFRRTAGGSAFLRGRRMRGAGPTPEKEDYSLNVINEMDIVLSNMNYPVIFLLFCWGAADSGVALPEPFPEARGPVYGCGVTPQGRSRGTRLSREWKNPGRLGTGTAEGKEGFRHGARPVSMELQERPPDEGSPYTCGAEFLFFRQIALCSGS